MAATGLAQRLTMDHVPIDELKKDVERAVRPPVEEDVDERDNETWTFPFSYTDRRGKVWQGTFTNKILTVGQVQLVAVLRARFAGGQSWDALDPSVNLLNRAIAHMSYSLEDKSRPEWAKDLLALRDPQVILALWEKVASHDARYFRSGEDQEEG